MHTQAQLCHIDTNRCVVMVTAYAAGEVLGSALGEATSAEQAEDRALERLRDRLKGLREFEQSSTTSDSTASPSNQQAETAAPGGQHQDTQKGVQKDVQNNRKTLQHEHPEQKAPEPAAEVSVARGTSTNQEPQAHIEPSESPTDPDDWSDELAAVDLEIQRIGWDREQERSYLERAFGHSSRHKLTRYNDLLAYLKRLKLLEPGTSVEAAPVPLRRGDLISQGDQMLSSLQWTGDQARSFLQAQLGANSRQALSDEQLLRFNMLLENELVTKTS